MIPQHVGEIRFLLYILTDSRLGFTEKNRPSKAKIFVPQLELPPPGTSPNWHFPQLELPQLELLPTGTFSNFFCVIENFTPSTAGTP